MFDKVSQAAEKLATLVSRRAFLGRLGHGALGLAAVIGGVLALPSQARAAQQYCVIGGRYVTLCYPVSAQTHGCPCGGFRVTKPVRCRQISC